MEGVDMRRISMAQPPFDLEQLLVHAKRKDQLCGDDVLPASTRYDNRSRGQGRDSEGKCWSCRKLELCKDGKIFFDALKAMSTRILFSVHAALTIWRVSLTRGQVYWGLGVSFLAMLVETAIVLIVRRANEWKWFSPCVLCYLLCVLPSFWILEIDQTNFVEQQLQNASQFTAADVYLAEQNQLWLWYLEQTMLILIIVGRWLLPKGALSRDELSALLLLYVAVASDIVDFFAILVDNDELKHQPTFLYMVMGTWTWSVVQFTFVYTATAGDPNDERESEEEEEERQKTCRGRFVKTMKGFLETEAWALWLSMLMQDGPFLVVRLVAAIEYNVLNNSTLFFITKNALVLMLQTYRLIAIHRERRERQARLKREASKRLLKALYRQAFQVNTVNKFRNLIPSVKVSPTGRDVETKDVV